MNRRYQMISADQFQRAAAGLRRMSSRALAVAEQVLVHGASQAAVLEEQERAGAPVTKQMVSAWVQRVYGAAARAEVVG